ncbi:MAG: hypothetical protein JKY49_14310 [Cohaesibacteraceae bacterium]|nr:hypothetical protein [Cohaesibacteraceae bacterium]
MWDSIAKWIAQPGIYDIYMLFAVLMMFVPLFILSKWYRDHARHSGGGRQLLARNKVLSGQDNHKLHRLFKLARDIETGTFGDAVRHVQHLVYGFIFIWLIAITFVFGLLVHSGNFR